MNSKQFLDQLFVQVEHHRRKLISQSWCLLQDNVERRMRLDAIIELSAELARIRAIDIQATALGEHVIEWVIQGEWDRAADTTQLLKFKHEKSEEYRARYAPLWENFVTLAETACTQARARLAGSHGGPS